MFRRTLIALLLLSPWAPAGVPAAHPGSQTRASRPARAEAPALEQLTFMAGSWQRESRGARTEEHWMVPRGGLMVGMHRVSAEGRPAWFEYLRIEEKDGVVRYLASPGGAEPTPFTLTRISSTRVVFENPEHDFPQRIIYERLADGRLKARIEGERGGQPGGTEWVFEPGSLR